MLQVPYEKLKYLDEVHFVSKDLHAKYTLREEGERCVVFTSAQLDVSYSLTLITTLADPLQTYIIDLRYNSNTQWDFLNFVLFCIENGFLSEGDVLVVGICANFTKFF